MASAGYPGNVQAGKKITGLDECAQMEDVQVFPCRDTTGRRRSREQRRPGFCRSPHSATRSPPHGIWLMPPSARSSSKAATFGATLLLSRLRLTSRRPMVRLVLSASLTIPFCVAARGQTSSASPATPSPTPAPALETLDAARSAAGDSAHPGELPQSRCAQPNGVGTGDSRWPV